MKKFAIFPDVPGGKTGDAMYEGSFRVVSDLEEPIGNAIHEAEHMGIERLEITIELPVTELFDPARPEYEEE
jgi:hypothetical protein